jgi:hypothetical protein
VTAKQRAASYGEALAQARESVSAARLRDPDEHFPYKADVVADLIEVNAPMGPGGPDDDRVKAEDVMSRRIAEASEAYIAAQAAHLDTPTDGSRSAYEAAKDDLVAARKTHRRNRVDAEGKPVGAVIGNTTAPAPDHMVGPRLRRVGEE